MIDGIFSKIDQIHYIQTSVRFIILNSRLGHSFDLLTLHKVKKTKRRRFA